MSVSGLRELHIATLCGSLREGSLTKALLQLAQREAPSGVHFVDLPLHDIPPYDADVQAMRFPDAVARLSDTIRRADAVLIGTPEYNYSIPGVLKNALDWVSQDAKRPFAGKPVAIMSASSGPWGGTRVQYDLRKVLLAMEAPVMGLPEVFVGDSPAKFDSTGGCTHDPTRRAVAEFMAAFAPWIVAGHGSGRLH